MFRKGRKNFYWAWIPPWHSPSRGHGSLGIPALPFILKFLRIKGFTIWIHGGEFLVGTAAGKAGELRKRRTDPINDFFLHVIELPFIVHLRGDVLALLAVGAVLAAPIASTGHCQLSAIRA